jgi:Prokaryotic dksA/traR C4-type zinc finger
VSGYNEDRVEALLRERSHGLTRTPFGPRRVPAETPAALLDREPAQGRPHHQRVTERPGVEPHRSERPPRRQAAPQPVHAEPCRSCTRPIGNARLHAVPDAVRCIDCQFAFEADGLASRHS